MTNAGLSSDELDDGWEMPHPVVLLTEGHPEKAAKTDVEHADYQFLSPDIPDIKREQ